MKTYDKQTLSFDSIPEVLGDIVDRLAKIDQVLTNFEAPKEEGDVWMSIDELIVYLPSNPAKQTVYGKVCRREIPYHKDGKKLVFLKAEIDAWLRESGSPTKQQIFAKVMQGGSR